MTNPGDINNICGTCEITSVVVDRPVSSTNFNIRCHVIPNRWVTFFVLNAGGIALDWFHSVFCREMTKDQFYEGYVPSVLEGFFKSDDPESLEAELPEYVPYLQGSRYSLEQLTASFSGLSLETTREKILLGLIKGIAVYHGENLKEVAGLVKLGRKVMTTGGGAKIRGYCRLKNVGPVTLSMSIRTSPPFWALPCWASFTRQEGMIELVHLLQKTAMDMLPSKASEGDFI